MKTITFRFDGIEPLLLHNNQTADPLNPYTKAMGFYHGKKKKTDADHLAISRLEWEAGLYFDLEGSIVIPGQNIEACIAAAGKKTKQGKNIKQSVRVEQNFITLEFPDKKIRRSEGAPQNQDALPSKSLDSLFAKYFDRRMAKNQKSTIVRTRPRFDKWSLTVDITFDEEAINERTLKEIIQTAGTSAGLGDYRERYGKFTATELK